MKVQLNIDLPGRLNLQNKEWIVLGTFFFEILPFVLEFIKMQRDEFFSGFKQVSLAATICQIVTWARDQDQSFSSRGSTASSKGIMPSLSPSSTVRIKLDLILTWIWGHFYIHMHEYIMLMHILLDLHKLFKSENGLIQLCMITWKNKHESFLTSFENLNFENKDILFCLSFCINHHLLL